MKLGYKKLTIGDFKREGIQGSFGHYFSHILPDSKEICLESCMGGYCVGIYDKKDGNLIGEKTCTKLEGYELTFMGVFNLQNGEALKNAVKIVNQKLHKTKIK